MPENVRVRFAPSPTGGLHLGGVRTVLYNFLFARQHRGTFVLRIEDTDQTRYVKGAEEYIFDCLKWCGLEPDESPIHGGEFGPYRQSERKDLYRKYAEQLVREGRGYYAFDRPEELETMRTKFKSNDNPSPQYDHRTRMEMRNSLTLTLEETQRLVEDQVPHVVRILTPEDEVASFHDMIRGEVQFNTSVLDDKVLLKADGMPTYHLAVVVDDFLMKISHAFRGEEWLPSAPTHILLWDYLFGRDKMPAWAHLPLIMGESGKLSKRDASRYGFPIFAITWNDPRTNEITEGFRERGFLPEAFVNMLAMLGWNDGTEKELYSINELIEKFSIERVHKGGAKFDFEKAKWFNHEWIKRSSSGYLRDEVKKVISQHGIDNVSNEYLEEVIALVKERCVLLTDFWPHAHFFFSRPVSYDETAIKPKWDGAKSDFFSELSQRLSLATSWQPDHIESIFKQMASEKKIKPGELLLPMRVMLVGGKVGPAVFEIASVLGNQETVARIQQALNYFQKM